jgi:hypothetical protein
MGIKGLIVPGACFVASLTVLVPDKDHVKEESREGIKYHPVKAQKVNYTPTLTAGPWIYIAGKTAGDMQTVHAAPAGLPHHFSDIEVQTRHIMEYLTAQIEANGSDGSLPSRTRLAYKSAAGLSRIQSGMARPFPKQRQGTGARLCARDRNNVSRTVDRDRSDLRRPPLRLLHPDE